MAITKTQAKDHIAALNRINNNATAMVRKVRGDMRDLERDWKLDAGAKAGAKRQFRMLADMEVRSMDLEALRLLREVKEYADTARARPYSGDAAAEIRRQRNYDAIKDALAQHQSDGQQAAEILKMFERFNVAEDLAGLEALREVVRHRELAGREVPAEVPALLDALAGPSECREAVKLLEVAEAACYGARMTADAAGRVIAEPPMEECGLVGVLPDGKTAFVLDPWKPEAEPVVQYGDITVTDAPAVLS